MHFLFNDIEGKMMERWSNVFYLLDLTTGVNIKHNALPHVILILPGHGSDKRKQHSMILTI